MDHDGQVKIKKESSSLNVCCRSDGSYYPYGTGISIDNDFIDELGAENLSVGDVVEVRGHAFVDSKSEHSDKDSSNKSVRLQMTSLKIKREDDDRVKQLYGE